MVKRILYVAVVVSFSFLIGCASVPLAPKEQDTAAKAFTKPAADKAGLYVYRNSFVGAALTKAIYLDGVLVGETANKTFFYKLIKTGKHQISTESEFGENDVTFQADGGKNYFAEQVMKMGVFVGGAKLEMVSEEVGMEEVLKCELALEAAATDAKDIPAATPKETAPIVETTANPNDCVISDKAFSASGTGSNTDVNIVGIEGEDIKVQAKSLAIGGGQINLWCDGAKHTWIGKLDYKGYLFASDKDNPLTFQVVKDKGYIYLNGKGTLKCPDGKFYIFSAVAK